MEKRLNTWKKSLKCTFGRKVGQEVAAEVQKADEAEQEAQQQQQQQRQQRQQHEHVQQQQQDHTVQCAQDVQVCPKQSGSWLKRTFGRKVGQQVRAEFQKVGESEQQQHHRQGTRDCQASLSPSRVLPMQEALSAGLNHEEAMQFARPADVRDAASEDMRPPAGLQTATANAGAVEVVQPRRFRMRTRLAGLVGFEGSSLPVRTRPRLHWVPVVAMNDLERWTYHATLPSTVTLSSAQPDGGAVQSGHSGSAIPGTLGTNQDAVAELRQSVVEMTSLDTSGSVQGNRESGRNRFATWSGSLGRKAVRCRLGQRNGSVSPLPPPPPSRPQIFVPPVSWQSPAQPGLLEAADLEPVEIGARMAGQQAEVTQGQESGVGGAEDSQARAVGQAHQVHDGFRRVEDLQIRDVYVPRPRRQMTQEEVEEKLRQVRAGIASIQQAAPDAAEETVGTSQLATAINCAEDVPHGAKSARHVADRPRLWNEEKEEERFQSTERRAKLPHSKLEGVMGNAPETQELAQEEQTARATDIATARSTDDLFDGIENISTQLESSRSSEPGATSTRSPEATENPPRGTSTGRLMNPEPSEWFRSRLQTRSGNDLNPRSEDYLVAVDTVIAEAREEDERVFSHLHERGEASTSSSVRNTRSFPARVRHANRDSDPGLEALQSRSRNVLRVQSLKRLQAMANGVVDGPSVLDEAADASDTSSSQPESSRARLHMRSLSEIRKMQGEHVMSSPSESDVLAWLSRSRRQDDPEVAGSEQPGRAPIDAVVRHSENAELQTGSTNDVESGEGSVGRASMEAVGRSPPLSTIRSPPG